MLHLIMKRSSCRAAGAGIALALTAATAPAQTVSGQVERSDAGRCCLSNFRYSGICEARVPPGESCGEVLSYLNNFQAVGRQYCGNTIIRGGWTLVSCGSIGDSVVISPGAIRASEPSTVTGTATQAPIGTVSPGTVRRSNATFITPIDASTARPAAAPGLIGL